MTLRRQKDLRHSTRCFFFGLAVADFFALPPFIFNLWFILHFADNFLNHSSFLCSTWWSVSHFFLIFRQLCLATVVTERVMLVLLPYETRVTKTRLKQLTAIVMAIHISISGIFFCPSDSESILSFVYVFMSLSFLKPQGLVDFFFFGFS